jgi:hypothetical protein
VNRNQVHTLRHGIPIRFLNWIAFLKRLPKVHRQIAGFLDRVDERT